MRIFSSLVMDAPGLCSPSRIVVSNMINFSLAMVLSGVCCGVPARLRTANARVFDELSRRGVRRAGLRQQIVGKGVCA